MPKFHVSWKDEFLKFKRHLQIRDNGLNEVILGNEAFEDY